MTVLCTSAQVHSLGRVSNATSQFDDQITSAIEIASDQVRAFTRRKFDLGTYTDYFMSPDAQREQAAVEYTVKEGPITAASAMASYDWTGAFDVTKSFLIALSENTEFFVNYSEGKVLFTGFFRPQRRGFKFTYIGGYAPDGAGVLQVPAKISRPTAIQASFNLQRIVSGNMGKATEERGAGRQVTRITYTKSATSGLLSEVQSMLLTERRILVGST
jgi:hypothetical protein